MEPLALAGIVGLLLIKEAGVPVPVPGDLVVIGAGASLAAEGPVAGIGALALILAAGYAGGTVQFALLRGAVREPMLRLLARFGIAPDRVERLAGRLRRTGTRGVAVSRMTPGVRVASIAACGLAGLPLGAFIGGLVIGNTVFVSAHFALGFVLGASAEGVLRGLGTAVGPIIVAVVALAAIGAAGWWWLRRRRRTASDELIPVAAAWADAACPACLALAVLEPRAER